MAGHVIDFAAVDVLVAALRDQVVPSGDKVRADVDPSALTPPCVWVQVTGVRLDILDGYTITTNLVCIANDQDHRRAMGDLADLFNAVTTVVDPTGPATTQGTILPDAPSSALPSLAVPYDLLAT